MAAKRLLTVLIVALAVAYYYTTLPVPPGFSARENRALRVLAFFLTISSKMQSIHYVEGITVSNFAMGLQGNFVEDDPNITYYDTAFDDVKVRVYEPVEETQTRAGLIYIHGGGWVLGNPGVYHAATNHLELEIGNVVLISIDYRLAWEAPFPASIDDVTDATTWFLRNLDMFNVDPDRVAVAGDSAGGNLAAALCQRLTYDKTYKDLPKMQFQGLTLPALQMFDLDLPSHQQNSQEWPTLILTKSALADFYSMYLNGNHKYSKIILSNNHTSPKAKHTSKAAKILSHKMIPDKFRTEYKPPLLDHGDKAPYDKIKHVLLDPDFAPLMRQNLRGLPPAYIITAEYDILRDDGILCGQRLKEAGVEVVWRHYDPAVHGFTFLTHDPLSIEAGKEAKTEFVKYAREKLKVPNR